MKMFNCCPEADKVEFVFKIYFEVIPVQNIKPGLGRKIDTIF